MRRRASQAPPGLLAHLAELMPGAEVVSVRPLGVDPDQAAGSTGKATGYGTPLKIELRDAELVPRTLVLHVVQPDEFGHDRRSDRAQQMLLCWDTFGHIPRHTRALDVGAVRPDGELVSLRDAGEFWLLTEWAPGREYARDLREVASRAEASARDLHRVEVLADYLVELHRARPPGGKAAYQRAIRDLVGHGEGVFGIADAYAADLPGAPLRRIEAIEASCVHWRWRLREHHHRLRRTHGDFHPFNLLFDGDALHVLDASRGALGDPADDVACLAINFPFFALDGGWSHGLAPLWHRFWTRYLDRSGDREVLAVVPPFLAWRALVLCCPRWYPDLAPAARDRLLTLAERALRSPVFDVALADEVMR